jgi:hypothetical protein
VELGGKFLVEPVNGCLILEGVLRGGVFGVEGVGLKATNPVDAEFGLLACPSGSNVSRS